jgi:hypothetical protein
MSGIGPEAAVDEHALLGFDPRRAANRRPKSSPGQTAPASPVGPPLVLEESQFDDWMRGPPEIAAEMMKPCGGAIEAWEVGAEVGNVKNNRPELMERVGLF